MGTETFLCDACACMWSGERGLVGLYWWVCPRVRTECLSVCSVGGGGGEWMQGYGDVGVRRTSVSEEAGRKMCC